MTTAPTMRQVKASAGSGKTHDITGKFLDYLANLNITAHNPSCALKTDPKHGTWTNILAITFTNAAASEMKERVIERLKKIALSNQEQDKDKQHPITPRMAKAWVDTILRQYGSLNIRTIDSLLHRIVRTAALDLGLPPDFETSFATNETLEPIFDSLLERAWQKDAVIEAMLHAICRSILLRDNSSGFATGGRILEATQPLLEQFLTENIPPLSSVKLINEKLKQLQDDFLNRCNDMLTFFQSENLQVNKRAFDAIIAASKGEKKSFSSAYLKKETLNDILLAKHKDTASSEAVYAYHKLSKAAHSLINDGHILQKAIELRPFVEFAKLIATEVTAFQQKEHMVAASTMPLLATKILNFEYGGVSTALCRLGSRINHILLDEFQDTSQEQWEALRPLAIEALSTGGSLTWVGDIKQAIYGWRGGNANLFDALCNEQELRCMVSADVDKATLDTNWRSREHVVNTNNKLFIPLKDKNIAQDVLSAMCSQNFPNHIIEDAAKKLSHAFSDVEQKVKPTNYAGGFITIEDVTGEDKEDLSKAVKEKLKERMLNLQKNGRPYADITILTRSNDGASAVAQWLMEWNIPVITENSLLLNTHPLIQESIAFLHFLNTPHDDLHFWTVLSGKTLEPYLGKENYSPSFDELHQFMFTRSKGTLYQAFKEKWPDFWEDIFAPFYNTAHLISPYNAIQEWYKMLAVPVNFPQADIFLRRFLEIIHCAAERDFATLSTFLEFWAKHGNNEKAPMPTQINAVQIMTIHKSKGLQFKVVIIPWTSFSFKNNDPKPVAYRVQDLDVIAPLCKEMGQKYYDNQIEQALETINVFYVACTRASEELHIFNTHTPNILKFRRNLACALEIMLQKASLTLPQSIGLAIELEDTEEAISLQSEQSINATAQISSDYVPEQKSYIPMEWMPSLKIFRNPLQELLLTPRLRGLLTHHCLEQLQNTGQAEHDARLAVGHGLRTFALPIEHSDTLQEELVKALTWYAKLPEVQEWTTTGLREQSLMNEDGQTFRADLLLPPTTEYGWRVVEFKTGESEQKHLKQVRNYLDLLDTIFIKQNDNPQLPLSQGLIIYLDKQVCQMVTVQNNSDFSPLPRWHKESV